MSAVTAQDLRDDIAGVLRRVEQGEDVVITVSGQPVAQLIPLPRERRRSLPRAELLRRLSSGQADAGLRDDLATLVGDTTGGPDTIR